jgi:isochorismate synthase
MQTERLLRDLGSRLHTLLEKSATDLAGSYLSIVLAIPLQSVNRYIDACGDCLYWSKPSRRHYRLAAGRLAVTEASGQQRFAHLEAARLALKKNWRLLDPDAVGIRNPVFCGFAFADGSDHGASSAGLPNSLLFVPEVLLDQQAHSACLVFTCHITAGFRPHTTIENWLYRSRRLLQPAAPALSAVSAADAPRLMQLGADRDAWTARVRLALNSINRGELEKLVLTRRRIVDLPQPFHLHRMLAWLEPHYPNCTQFALRNQGQTLIGASPEQLLAQQGTRLHLDAVGGTGTRSADPVRDQQLTEALEQDRKTLHEHRLIVDDIVRRLKPLCSSLVYPERPAVMKLPAVQHLTSRISGQALADTPILRLAKRLHPTPAVGGLPRQAALRWLAANGERQRGWYTGALGWLDVDGGGELAVILRCAVLGQQQAILYAGAGIVAGSDPQQEFLETEWKLQTMVAAVQAGGDEAQRIAARQPAAGLLG